VELCKNENIVTILLLPTHNALYGKMFTYRKLIYPHYLCIMQTEA